MSQENDFKGNFLSLIVIMCIVLALGVTPFLRMILSGGSSHGDGGSSSSMAQVDASQGEALFNAKGCVACHKTDSKLVGPSLIDIANKYKGQNALGDLANKVKNGSSGVWGAVPMPPNAQVSDADIKTLVSWILGMAPTDEAATPDGGDTPDQPEKPVVPEVKRVATAAEVNLGNDLFLGKKRFKNKGPACLACHTVQHSSVIGGGILAKELTTCYGTFGEAGVRAFITTPVNDIMKTAYADRPITEEETVALIAFLEQVNKEEAMHLPADVGIKLFGAGVIGTIFLLIVYSCLWRGRKRGSVNQEIFDRQVKSL